MRNRTPKLLAFALAAVMVLGMPVSAMEIYENPEGETIDLFGGDTLQNNYGIVWGNNTDATVVNNYGTVQENHSYATVVNNYGTVSNNQGIVENNYGTVKNVGGGYVVNNFGGDVEGGVDDQYYELPVPQNFSYEGAKKSDDRWWINWRMMTTTLRAQAFQKAWEQSRWRTITKAAPCLM